MLYYHKELYEIEKGIYSNEEFPSELEIKTSGVMVKCNHLKIYMDLLSKMKGKMSK